MSLMGQINVLPAQTKSWTPLGWVMAGAALMAFSAALITYHPQLPTTPSSAQNMNAPAPLPADEQQLVSQVSQRAPDVRSAYEDSLREVNAYISDAEQAVANDPQDSAAHEQLMEAYQQKEMLYQMATVRSLP